MLTTRPPDMVRRLARLLLLLAIVFAGAGLIVGYARGAETDANAGQLLGAVERGEISCDQLSASQATEIGELMMGRMVGSPRAHEAMDELMARMMGEPAEEQMHRAMGQRIAGCGGVMPVGFSRMMGAMAMMGGFAGGSSASGLGPSSMMGDGMMGGTNSYYGSTSQTGDDDVSAAWMVVPMAVLLLGGLAVLLVLLRPRHSGQGAAPLDLLARRFAAGEISADDFRERRQLLERGRSI